MLFVATGAVFVRRSLTECEPRACTPLTRSSVKTLNLLYVAIVASYLALAKSPWNFGAAAE